MLGEILSVAQVTTKEELAGRLASGKPLRVKLGIDPTSSSVHLGHAVVLRMLRKFQDNGHTAVLIVGDATACIGDPTGRTETRPTLSLAQARENAKTYLCQISKIIDTGKAEIHYNSGWFERFGFGDALELCAKITVQQVLNRNDFAQRMENEVPISLHELMYPLMQAQDSVQVKADVELGGTEQLFNLMLGRDFQKTAGQSPQVCITLPILVGTDGEKKMGKSLGNFIGLDDEPLEMFSKVMSIPDKLMPQWFDLLTDYGGKYITRDGDNNFVSPMQTKKMLALAIVENLHTKDTAVDTCKEWFQIHSERKDPTNISEITLASAVHKELPAFQLLFSLGLVDSKNEARRLIEQGGITTSTPIAPTEKVKVESPFAMIPLANGTIIRIGSRRVVQIKVDSNG